MDPAYEVRKVSNYLEADVRGFFGDAWCGYANKRVGVWDFYWEAFSEQNEEILDGLRASGRSFSRK